MLGPVGELFWSPIPEASAQVPLHRFHWGSGEGFAVASTQAPKCP